MTDASAQLMMNWARELAVMSEHNFLIHYYTISDTARKQLKTFPVIKYSQKTCAFPWIPPSISSLQEASPPMTHAVPSSSRDGLPATLPHPEIPTNTAPIPLNPAADVDMTTNEEVLTNNNQQEPPEQQNETPARTNRTNGRRRRVSANSNDSYEAPRTVNRLANPVNEYEEVQRLLRTFGQKRKYQRYVDSRPVPQPQFATAQYNELLREQTTEEEELIAKLFIEIKENLYLAYENESRSNHHHFVVAEKLVMLKERVGVERFDRMLADEFGLSKK
jgi:hypothetical protein